MAADQVALFRRAWLPVHPQGSVLLVHGLGEHSGRYDEMGAWLAARDLAVHAYDQRGHGRTEGPRGHIRSFSDLLDDLDEMREVVLAQEPDLPLAIVGHSMGGLVVANYACERAPRIAAVATSGAALAVPDNVSAFKLALVRGLSASFPRLRLDAAIDPAGLSHDAGVVSGYTADPLVFPKITLRFASELFGAMRRTSPAAARVRLPMLLQHGEADPICPAAASRQFFAGLEVDARRLEIYPGLLHEIFNETERERVLVDLYEWLRERMQDWRRDR